MRKILILFILSILALNVNAKDLWEDRPFYFGLGTSLVQEVDAGSASNYGMVMEFGYKFFHVDLSSNLTAGKGEELEYRSSHTTLSNKKLWSKFHVGFNISIGRLMITPKMGAIFVSKIYEDGLAFDTYYIERDYSDPSMGIDTKFIIRKGTSANMYIKGSAETQETYSITMGLAF